MTFSNFTILLIFLIPLIILIILGLIRQIRDDKELSERVSMSDKMLPILFEIGSFFSIDYLFEITSIIGMILYIFLFITLITTVFPKLWSWIDIDIWGEKESPFLIRIISYFFWVLFFC